MKTKHLQILLFISLTFNSFSQWSFDYGVYDYYTDNDIFNYSSGDKLCALDNDDYWFNHDGKIAYYRGKEDYFVDINIRAQSNPRKIWKDNEGNILFQEGPPPQFYRDTNRLVRIHYTDSMDFTIEYLDTFPRTIQSFVADSNNIYWLTFGSLWNSEADSTHGIYSYDGSQLTFHPLTYGDSTVFFLGNSSSWVSTINKYGYIYMHCIFRSPNEPIDNVRNGLLKFNTNDGSYSVISESTLGYSVLEIVDIVSDTLGDIWFTTPDEVVHFDHNSETIINVYSENSPFEHVGNYNAYQLAVDASNRVWVGYSSFVTNAGWCHLHVYWFDGVWNEYYDTNHEECGGFGPLTIDSKGRKIHGVTYGFRVWEDSLTQGGFYSPFNSNSPLASLTEIDDNLKFEIYPNPTDGFFKIRSEIDGELRITSIQGKIVFKDKINAGETQYNTTRWDSGVYIIKFIKGERTFNSLLVVN